MLIFFSREKTKNLHIFIAFYFEILIHYACVVVFWYNIGLDSGWVWVYMGYICITTTGYVFYSLTSGTQLKSYKTEMMARLYM